MSSAYLTHLKSLLLILNSLVKRGALLTGCVHSERLRHAVPDMDPLWVTRKTSLIQRTNPINTEINEPFQENMCFHRVKS